ncbi:solute carrier family 22 member 1-like [Antedon mediterranea]|uniref:solute carrier family 22 member 1-like n=1 Tax=Antedon mediterranea TaxID=105859 RepID=UPI003AF47672
MLIRKYIAMKFNDIFVYTGQYGLYQKIISISVCFFITSNVLATISVVFTNGDMDHHCKYVESYNATAAVSADSGADYDGICEDSDCWEEGLRNLPADDKSSLLINETQCTMYIVESNVTDLVKCKHGWTYDRSQYDSTIVSAFDLVCEDSYKVSLSISLINAGSFFGSILCGFVCDYFGRKKTIVVSYCLKFIIGILTGIAPNYWTFAILRFISGCIFTYIPVFVYVTEIVGPSKRAMVATLVTVYWCFGYMLLAVMAYFVRSWNILTLVINLVFVPFLSIFFFIPESPRWLILKDRKEEAKRVLQQIAKVNKKKKIPDETLELLEDNEV